MWTEKKITCKSCGMNFTVFNCECYICQKQLKIELCNLCMQVKEGKDNE